MSGILVFDDGDETEVVSGEPLTDVVVITGGHPGPPGPPGPPGAVGVYAQDDDPGAVPQGSLWIVPIETP